MKYFNKSKCNVLSLLILLVFTSGCIDKNIEVDINDSLTVSGELIYQNNFDENLDDWNIEQMSGGTVKINDGELEITDVAGCTVWLNKKFTGDIIIEYDVFVIDQGGPQDRVSDLNCFWMAKDPKSPENLFEYSKQRGGRFSNYDTLQLYYMGVGGNNNSTTRFRKYKGNGERPLLPEHDLKGAKNMLEPNKEYKIRIVSHNGIVQYYRNDQLLVNFYDTDPYTSGYFGLRTVKNHMTVDNFKVYQLENKE